MSEPDDVYCYEYDTGFTDFDTGFIANFKYDRKQDFNESIRFYKLRTCSRGLFNLMMSSRSINCITSVLDGQAGVTFNLNAPLLYGGYPLHYAAANMQYDLVDLFLHHGARTDKRTIAGENTKGGLLPLNVALEMLNYHYYLSRWTPEKSILNLIFKLCLPQVEIPLGVCRLIAQNTEGIDEVFKQYCMDGRIVEATALLMVARKKCLDATNKSLSIEKCIVKEIEWLNNAEKQLMPSSMKSKLVQACESRKATVVHVLAILEIFKKAGDAIETYVQTERHMLKEKIINDVKMLLKEKEINLVDKDTDLSDVDPERNLLVDVAKELRQKNVAAVYFPKSPYPVMYPENHMFWYPPNSPFGNYFFDLEKLHEIREKSRFIDQLVRRASTHGIPEKWKERELVDLLNREAAAFGYIPHDLRRKRGYSFFARALKKGRRIL